MGISIESFGMRVTGERYRPEFSLTVGFNNGSHSGTASATKGLGIDAIYDVADTIMFGQGHKKNPVIHENSRTFLRGIDGIPLNNKDGAYRPIAAVFYDGSVYYGRRDYPELHQSRFEAYIQAVEAALNGIQTAAYETSEPSLMAPEGGEGNSSKPETLEPSDLSRLNFWGVQEDLLERHLIYLEDIVDGHAKIRTVLKDGNGRYLVVGESQLVKVGSFNLVVAAQETFNVISAVRFSDNYEKIFPD